MNIDLVIMSIMVVDRQILGDCELPHCVVAVPLQSQPKCDLHLLKEGESSICKNSQQLNSVFNKIGQLQVSSPPLSFISDPLTR